MTVQGEMTFTPTPLYPLNLDFSPHSLAQNSPGYGKDFWAGEVVERTSAGIYRVYWFDKENVVVGTSFGGAFWMCF